MTEKIRRLGWLCLCLLAAVLFLFVQFAVFYGALGVVAVQAGGSPLDILRDVPAGRVAWAFGDRYSMELTLAGQAVSLLIGLPVWYLALACSREEKARRAPALPGRRLWWMLPAGLGIQLLCDLLIRLENVLAPQLVEEYSQLMEEAGVGELRWQVLLATVLLAPIVEEVFCRGLMLGFAVRAVRPFWLANTIQALLFGVLHMNWVQGIYAFIIGLLLGAVYRRWHRLWYCILMHGAVNATASLAGVLQVAFGGGPGLVVMAFAGAALLERGLLGLGFFARAGNRPGDANQAPEKWIWRP